MGSGFFPVEASAGLAGALERGNQQAAGEQGHVVTIDLGPSPFHGLTQVCRYCDEGGFLPSKAATAKSR